MGLGLQRAEARHLLFAQEIIADQDVVDTGIRHHLGFTDLLAGNAFGAGLDLELRQNGTLVGLDVGTVGDTGRVASLLHARDVALDPVHVDDGDGRAVFAGNFGGAGCGHDASLFRVLFFRARILNAKPVSTFAEYALKPVLFLHVALQDPAICPRLPAILSAPWSAHRRPGRISCDPSCRGPDRQDAVVVWRFQPAIWRWFSAGFRARVFH